ncbi:MAG: hypothetical protein OEV35_01700 [Gallionellaceae bacterium]|nr:hypothetical protein [Gallionellaceae bacterium]
MKLRPAISALLAAMLLAGMLLTGGCSLLSGLKPRPEPKPEFAQVITVAKPVKSVPITVSYLGGALYRVQVSNNLQSEIKLMWDQSTYATTTKESVRLFHVQDKNNLPQHPPGQQPPSSIPPNSQFQADFTGDDWLACIRAGCSPQPRNDAKGARIYLAFNIKGKKVKWQGEVTFIPPGKNECEQKQAGCTPPVFMQH